MTSSWDEIMAYFIQGKNCVRILLPVPHQDLEMVVACVCDLTFYPSLFIDYLINTNGALLFH